MQSLFGVPSFILRLLSINLTAFARPALSGVGLWEAAKHSGWLLLVFSAQLPLLYYLHSHTDDLTLLTGSLSISLTNLLTIVKMSALLIYRQGFVELIERVDQLAATIGSAEAQQRLKHSNALALRMVKPYIYLSGFTGVYFLLDPILKSVYAQIMHSHVNRILPMPMRFPFDYESWPGYHICYIYTLMVTYAVVLFAGAVDGIFVIMAFNLSAHFSILQQFIETNGFRKRRAQLDADLSSYVKYHDSLLHLTQHLRHIYQPIIFAQFCITSLELCVIIYQMMTRFDSVGVLITYLAFLLAILLQLLLYCYGGELIQQESFQVSRAVQLSDWYNLEPQHRRALNLVLLRSQRAANIRMGFYEVSLSSFATILKAAMSYITLIQSIE